MPIVTAMITAGGDFESKALHLTGFHQHLVHRYNAPTTATGTITVKADAIGTGMITVKTLR